MNILIRDHNPEGYVNGVVVYVLHRFRTKMDLIEHLFEYEDTIDDELDFIFPTPQEEQNYLKFKKDLLSEI